MNSPNEIYGYHYGLVNKTPLQDICDRMQADGNGITKEQEQKILAYFGIIIPLLFALTFMYYTIIDWHDKYNYS
jgi:hypothetical protein